MYIHMYTTSEQKQRRIVNLILAYLFETHEINGLME